MSQEADKTAKGEHIDAHRFCTRNRIQLEESSECGCFKCLAIFSPKEINLWWTESTPADVEKQFRDTATCPHCGIDSVIGSASGYPITEQFLRTMRSYWFGVDE